MKKTSFILIAFILLTALIWFSFSFIINKGSKNELLNSPQTQEKIVLKFGHNTPEESALHQGALRFADEVNRKTNGDITIEVFPSQKLGNDHQMLEMARSGEIDILLTPTAKMSVAVPSMQYADLPFFFPSREDLYEMLDGEPGRMLLEDLNKIGLVGITFWENGFKHFTANNKIESPEDFTGKKIRVMKSRMIMEQFKSLGANPITIDFHATKKALADGVVDGQENPLIAIVSMGFYKEQTHLTLSEHAYLGYVLSMSEKLFDKVSQSQKDILIGTANSVTNWEREETQRREAKLIELIKDSGVIVTKLSEENRLKFAAKTNNLVQKFEDTIGPDLISKTQELLAQKYRVKNKEIIIAMDLPLDDTSKSVGLDIKRGAELAIDEINTQGGILGKNISLIVKDNRISPTIGLKNVNSFIENEDVVAIVGGKHSGIVTKQIPAVQEAKIPFLIPWAAAAENIDNGYSDNYVFRIGANDKYASKFIVDSVLKDYKKPAIIVENTLWGRNNLKSMKKLLENEGVLDAEGLVYNRGEKDFKENISKIIKEEHDAVIIVANANEGIALIKEISSRDVALPVFAHWGVYGGDFFKETNDLLNQVNFQIFNTSNNQDIHRKLLEKYLMFYGKNTLDDIKVPMAVSHSYDLIHLLVNAIKKADSLDRVAVKKSLENLGPYSGAVKEYERAFSSTKHDALSKDDYIMLKF